MNIIIIGLGSMGKRRARCLQALGEHQLFGYDINSHRVSNAIPLNIKATENQALLPWEEADAYFICTPPDQHETYLMLGLEYKKPCFVEASVILDGLEAINKEAKIREVFIAPSCTLLYHPAIEQIKKIICSSQYGKISNFSYHCGQYLPDWHPWEAVQDYYVSNPLTGGCREIVPFELTWLTECFGFPQEVVACYGRTIDVGAKIDDTYAISLKFKEHLGTMLVDVTSRYAIRQLVLNFEQAQLHWRWDRPYLEIFDVNKQQREQLSLTTAKYANASGYNQNITEDMYVNEVAAFLTGINSPRAYPNTLDKDIQVLKLLNALERR